MAKPVETWLIVPPAELVTREVAVHWLRFQYPALSDLVLMRPHLDWVRGVGRRRDRDYLDGGLRVLARDIHKVTRVCGRVLADGRPRRLGLSRNPMLHKQKQVLKLRRVVRFERFALKRGFCGPGGRGLLQRSLRVQERALGPWRAAERRLWAEIRAEQRARAA